MSTFLNIFLGVLYLLLLMGFFFVKHKQQSIMVKIRNKKKFIIQTDLSNKYLQHFIPNTHVIAFLSGFRIGIGIANVIERLKLGFNWYRRS